MNEELLVPFYTEHYETPSDTLIKDGPRKYNTAYCFKKTFALGSESAKNAHDMINQLKGYDFKDIAEERVEKVSYINVYFKNKLYDLYNTEESILGGLEHIKDEHSPLHISRDIEKQELLDKEKKVLDQLNEFSSDSKQKNEKLQYLLQRLKATKREIIGAESVINELEEIIKVKTQSEEKQGTPKM